MLPTTLAVTGTPTGDSAAARDNRWSGTAATTDDHAVNPSPVIRPTGTLPKATEVAVSATPSAGSPPTDTDSGDSERESDYPERIEWRAAGRISS